MDCGKIGNIIRELRLEKGMTQKQLADQMVLSDKTVSKWERGLGMPDVSLLSDLAGLLGIKIEQLLSGSLSPNDIVGGNMKKTKYFVCSVCGSLSFCAGSSQVSCCGRPLKEQKPQKAGESQKLRVEVIEDDWYVTSMHPMTKEHFISFVAFATGDNLQIIKQYPEWNLQLRIPKRAHGTLLWYDTCKGLFFQLL